MPNIGPMELIIVLAIVLLIVGPKKLPEMGSAMGRTIRDFRKASSEMTEAVKTDSQPNTLQKEAAPDTSVETSAAPTTEAAPAIPSAEPSSGAQTDKADESA
jgi:sec-independent protein translocase protein TatA